MADVVIKGGTVVSDVGVRRADVAIQGQIVVAVGDDLTGDLVLDAGGCVVGPGLVDLHTHLRQPGREEAETVESGSRSAALGGYTALVAMPDTQPVMDNAAVVREVQHLAHSGLCDVEVAGAITVGRDGTRLAPMGEMAALGVRLFTDDGRGVQDERLMRRALDYASGLGVTLAQNPDNEAMSRGGHMNEGPMSSELGIPGIPAEAEELMVIRDVTLSRLTGGRVHFQTLTTAGSVGIVRAAKASGLPITAEAAPHHWCLTDAAVATYDPNFKVDPPLRQAHDVEALRSGIREGVIDAIATDHSPQEIHLKELPFDEAPPGVVGLETAAAAAITELDLGVEELFAALSTRPAQIAGIDESHGGPVLVGRSANLAVIDPNATWVVDGAAMASRSSNTAFHGRTLKGRVRHTLHAGDPVVIDGEAQR
ncbi:MAG: dihydroorotase [Acidimicrobiales bacterium]